MCLRLRVAVRDLKLFHGHYERLEGRVNVPIDEVDELYPVFFVVAGAVDYPHLFNEGTLPGLTGPWRGKEI